MHGPFSGGSVPNDVSGKGVVGASEDVGAGVLDGVTVPSNVELGPAKLDDTNSRDDVTVLDSD
jgi:hypothetical protein